MDGSEGALAHSLRFRLSLWLSVAIVLIAAVAGTFAFVAALDEAHRLQDNQLQQTGYLISRLDAVPASPMAREKAGDVDFDARVVVRFLPWAGAYAQPERIRPPNFSPLLKDGLQTVTVGHEHWRVFVKSRPNGVRVAVGQQTRVRDAAARVSALRTVAPILFLVPLLLVLVGVVVRQMLIPFTTLAAGLERRGEGDLGDLSEAGLPSEAWPFVREINQLLGRMGRSMALQRRFIADAAHELRSPLTAMSLQAERLAAAPMPDEARSRLQALIQGLKRTRVLLDQLLTLARMQEPASAAQESVALEPVIRELLEDLVPLAEEKQIDLGVLGAVSARVQAKPVDLKILLKNLVDNAIRYTPPGGRIDIAVEQRGALVALQVNDTGPGIPLDELERVFDPFYRVLGNGEIGSGLGLAITRTVAAGIGAVIELRNAVPPATGLHALVTFQAAPAPD